MYVPDLRQQQQTAPSIIQPQAPMVRPTAPTQPPRPLSGIAAALLEAEKRKKSQVPVQGSLNVPYTYGG